MNTYPFQPGTTALRIPPEVKALLSALQLSGPDFEPLKRLSDQQWASLLAFSDIAQLTLVIAELPMLGFPSWVVERLRGNLADNALRLERVKATYREAADALERAGVEHVVIKGFTQSPDYVADPRLRAQSDIDLFCSPESIDAAHNALLAAGYKPSDAGISSVLSDHQVSLVRPGNWQWRGNPFDPEMPLSIELHFCFWNERVSCIGDPGTSPFWERRTTREIEDFRFACLSPIDHLAYLTLHILRNLLIRDWIIHHVRELAVFLNKRANDEAFWKLWDDANSPQLRSFSAIAFHYAHSWFGCRLHPSVAREIDGISTMRRSWLKSFSGSALELMFHPNKDSVWLHLTFLSTPGDKWRILKRSLIPPGIGPIGVVPLQVRNKQLVRPRGRYLWQQYIDYLITRSFSYGRTSLATLGRGLRWRLSSISPYRSFGQPAA